MSTDNLGNATRSSPDLLEKQDSPDENISTSSPASSDVDIARPTHRVHDMKAGDHGVQLLVSTKDHLYDAKTVHGGAFAWQCVGSWEDPTIQKVATILSQRESTGVQNNANTQSAEQRHGKGHTLGSFSNIGTSSKATD